MDRKTAVEMTEVYNNDQANLFCPFIKLNCNKDCVFFARSRISLESPTKENYRVHLAECVIDVAFTKLAYSEK